MSVVPGQSVLVYDIGGSHASAARCSTNGLELAGLERAPLADSIAPEAFVELLINLGRAAVPGELISGASFAVPGPFDCAAGISYMKHKLPSLYGYDLRSPLAAGLGCSPNSISFLSDAGAFLLGELRKGAAHGASRAVGITLGTGIGAAFAQNNQWITEGPSVPPGGEIWNLPYEDGTVEDLLSTRALRKDYTTRTGRDLEVSAIAAAALKDEDARAVFHTFGVHLGQVFRAVLGPFAPEVVVIGGGISRSAQLFLPAAQAELAGLPGFRLVPSVLLEQATLFGAGAFWTDNHPSYSDSSVAAARK
ncbi:MAG TPA: ROK family protein [Terracidiphilus sp.]|nr:ROK family protein [Terracidiphilus sp.]